MREEKFCRVRNSSYSTRRYSRRTKIENAFGIVIGRTDRPESPAAAVAGCSTRPGAKLSLNYDRP